MGDWLSIKKTKSLISDVKTEPTAAAEAYNACCNSLGSIGSNIDGRRPLVCNDILRSK